MNTNDFSKGFACAVVQIIETHGEQTIAEDACKELLESQLDTEQHIEV